MYVAYVLILCLGLRKGEVLGPQWRDVALEQGELQIRNQLQRIQRVRHHRETKTEGSSAPLPLPRYASPNYGASSWSRRGPGQRLASPGERVTG
jgi:integrase